MLFWRKNIEDGNCPSPGLFAAPELEFPGLSLISYVKPIEKYLAFEPRSGSKSELYSQSKHAEKRKSKNLTRKRNFKSIRTRPLCAEFQIYRMA
jgi:hypothetical protein